MKIVLFSLCYSRLLLGVMLGQRQTPYPLCVLWALATQQIHRFVKPMEQLSLQNDVFNKTKTSSTVQTNRRVDSSSVLQRVAKGDRRAIKDCINNYGDLIWSMAKKFTDSTEDAEAVTEEIFLNIWRYAARFEQTNFDELLFITIIARRQLRKYSEKSNHSIN